MKKNDKMNCSSESISQNSSKLLGDSTEKKNLIFHIKIFLFFFPSAEKLFVNISHRTPLESIFSSEG